MKKLTLIYLIHGYKLFYIKRFIEDLSKSNSLDQIDVCILYSNGKIKYDSPSLEKLFEKRKISARAFEDEGIRTAKILNNISKIKTDYSYIVDGDDTINTESLDKAIKIISKKNVEIEFNFLCNFDIKNNLFFLTNEKYRFRVGKYIFKTSRLNDYSDLLLKIPNFLPNHLKTTIHRSEYPFDFFLYTEMEKIRSMNTYLYVYTMNFPANKRTRNSKDNQKYPHRAFINIKSNDYHINAEYFKLQILLLQLKRKGTKLNNKKFFDL